VKGIGKFGFLKNAFISYALSIPFLSVSIRIKANVNLKNFNTLLKGIAPV
jgi:hypothetical protein